MPTSILRFKIFISCPGDVDAERQRLEKFFKTAEAALDQKGIPASLVTLYWKNIVHEYDNTRGQTVINIEFNDYDYYIAILASRFGTPTVTEDGQHYGSGTEEEFRIAFRKREVGEHVKLYIFFKNVQPPTDPALKEQYDRVIAFKTELQPGGWVNSFDDPIDLSDKLNIYLIPKIEKEILGCQTDTVREYVAIAEITEVPTPDGPTVALATLTEDLVVVPGPIHRTVTLEDGDEINRMLFSEDYKKQLPELVKEKKRIVLLGNAGSGKSTELAKLVNFYKAPGSQFVPVFARLNTYKGGSIAAFLPEEYKSVPEAVVLLILDGLDEVEPEHFTEAIDQITLFAENDPQLRMVISCRTNFFEVSIGAEKAYLSDFAISRMNEITPKDIVESLNAAGIDGEAFFREAVINEYQELISKPFFLNILSTLFKKTQSLQGGRANIFSAAITLKLENEQGKDGRPPIDMPSTFRLLTRLGLIMECLGRNYLMESEIKVALPVEGDLTVVRDSSLISPLKGRWSFEHNNIQEYFAALGMTGLTIDQIKELVAFRPDHTTLKPSWLNTLSFLVSIMADDKRQQLLDWIIEIEPEAVIRFEPDRVDPSVRFRVFSKIFREFQQNGLWIKSNKFTEPELGRFGDSPQSLQLLTEAITSVGNSITNKVSALRLLGYFKLRTTGDRKAVIDLILNFIAQHENQPEPIYSAIHVLVDAKLADEQIVHDFVAKYRSRTEPYYRAALYTLITKTNHIDEYLGIFTEGIIIVGNRERSAQQHNLWDETMQLKTAFSKIRSTETINQALQFFAEPYDPRYRYYSDKKDVLQTLTAQAIELFSANSPLFDTVLTLYVNYAKISDRNILGLFRQFFEKTGTLENAFESVYHLAMPTEFEKNMLLSILLTDSTVQFLLNEWKQGILSSEQLKNLVRETDAHTAHTNDAGKANEFKAAVEKQTDIAFDESVYELRRQKHRQREQDSFDILFSPDEMKAQMERFWKEYGKTEAEWNEVWDFANRYEMDIDAYLPRTVTNIVADHCRDGHYTSKAIVDDFMADNQAFEDYRIDSIMGMLKNSLVQVSDAQRQVVEEWANRKAQKINIARSITPEGRMNELTLALWYFIKKLAIILPNDKMLDFTMFYDYSHQQLEDWYQPIVTRAGSEAFDQRIITNLKAGILQEKIWSNNAQYAIAHSLKDAYPNILEDLVRLKEVTSVKEPIAKLYLEATDDQEGLFKVLIALQPDEFRWEVYDLLKTGRLTGDLENFLITVLHNDEEQEPQKLEAAKRLTELANFEGFTYYAQRIGKNRTIQNRSDLWLRYLSNLTSLDFLPGLMQLLEESLMPENRGDVFTRFDGQVIDSIFNMAIQSQENLDAVTIAMGNKISQHNGAWNYLIPVVKRMDFQYNLNRAGDMKLEQAIERVNALGF